jgi:signal transduction histidine kinase
MISHDLKSPLSSILSMLELLEESDGDLPGMDRRSVYKDLKSSVAVLLEMTTQLLNLHRLQSGSIEINKEAVEPRFIAKQVRLSLDQRLNEKGIEFRNEFPPGEVVEADLALFREVLFNLLSNAVKFCESGDVITVRRGDHGCLEVVDTGIGISEELLPELFQKEKKTTTLGTQGEPGTGLGLPLCKDIMEAHGGEISVRSQPGEGSAFCLRFPELSHSKGTGPWGAVADSVS